MIKEKQYLSLALTGSLILCIVDLTIQLKNMKLFPSILPDILTGCQVDVPLDIARIPYISAFVVDTSIFMLTIWRTWTLNKSGDGSPLINRLARDGTVFYLINSASLAFAIVGLGLGVSGYLIAFHSALCTRMVLSLRTYEPGGLPTTDIKVGAIPAGFTLRSGTNTSIAHAHDSSTLIELGDATNFSQEAPP
ncbi:hypothetical protein FRC09_006287 [Ceratobasidium sp. 395]|nr:hypothetical protein FRC09_006287 [Ceratobasidium sp. 395]